MNITLSDNKPVPKYPWVGTYATWVVLFIGENEGVILKGDSQSFAGIPYPFSNEERYVPWSGKITIEV